MTQEKPEFPKEFNQCPNCGSTRRIANEVLQTEKDKEKIREQVKAFMFQTQCLIVDQTKAWLSAPMILAWYDVCVDCGTFYCIHANVKTAMPQMGKPKGQQQGGIFQN